MVEIEVKGHSGCQIDVVNENSSVYVYKSTVDPKYLKRLVLQAKKQQAASEVEFQHIRVPKIYDIKKEDSFTSVKMQYVYSKNFIEFFEQAGFEQLDYFIGALEYFIEYEISHSELQKVSPEIFQKKFADIRSKVEKNSFYLVEQNCLKPEIQNIIDQSQRIFDNLQEMLIPIGVCHGDLTFSNILFNGNNYYLIDFLDSFIETPLQDIVKIRQDTAYRWSQLMYTKPYDAVRLHIICDKIDQEIDSYFVRKYQWYTENYRIMQLMNILRILPYAHEEKVIDYLVGILNEILNEFESKDTYSSIINKHCSEDSVKCEDKTLIMPIASNKPEYEHHIPHVFQLAEDGTMLCIKALQSLDLSQFNKIYITILESLDKRYSIGDMLRLQFRINGIKNGEIVVLDKPTLSQPETIYQTIKIKNICGSIVVKDADCSFMGDNISGNAIVVYPLEQLKWVNPQNKSYVNVDDMYYITNIIEKRIVSHYFTAGAYSFESSDYFCETFEHFLGQNELYLSHVIYSMLLDKNIFRPIVAKQYEDFDLKY